MKEAVVLVLVAVVIVAGIGIWLANGGTVPFFSSQPPAVQPASDAQPGSDAAKETAAAKPVKPPAAKAKKTSTVPLAEASPEPLVVGPVAEVVVAPPPPPKQFPSADQISVGAERE